MNKRKRESTKLAETFNSIDADFSLHSAPDSEGVKTIFRCHQAKLAASPVLLSRAQAIASGSADVKPVLHLEEAAETLNVVLRLLYEGIAAMPNPSFISINLFVSIYIACAKYGLQDVASAFDGIMPCVLLYVVRGR